MFSKIKLKPKIILSYVLVILISFGLIAFFLDAKLEKQSLEEIKSSLLGKAYLIENQIKSENLSLENATRLYSLVKTATQKQEFRLTVIDKNGHVLADTERSQTEVLDMENHLGRPEVQSALHDEIGENIRYSSTLKIDMLYVALPIKSGGDIPAILRVALPLTSVKNTLFTVRKTIFLGLFFALVLAFILGSILAVAIIKPINKIITASRKLSQGDFSRRIVHNTQDEIGELSLALNKMAQDIEDKIKEVKAQNQQLNAVFNSMIEGVIVVDKKSSIVSINHTVEKVFGVLKENAEGKFFLEAIRNNDISEIINYVLSKGEPISKELNLSWPVQKIFQVNAASISEKDRASGCLLVIHDITELRKLETMRRDFVANVSHELKTPLTSIKGFVDTLIEGAWEDKENSRHFLRIIQDHANRLNNLINDLLDLSHIESGEIKLELSDFNMQVLADDILSSFKSRLKRSGIEAKDDLPSDSLIKADKDKIEQVLTNLIDNAIKFNKNNGTIRIYSQEPSGAIKFVVEDSGMGIPEKDMPRIFERFYRVDKARSRELGGTGLGLSIVKHIVELHGGSVGVESVEGLGSKFWFSLPKI